MTTLYLDCFSGAAGDMILGALVDAGANLDEVIAHLRRLPVEGWDVQSRTTTKGALRATQIEVVLDDPKPLRYPEIVGLIEAAALPERARRRALDAFRLLGEAEANVHGVELSDLHLHEAGALDAVIDIVGTCVALESLGVERVFASPVATGRGIVDPPTVRYPSRPPR